MASSASPALWWVRRDLRLADNPALRAAIDEGEAVLPLFVLDPMLLGSAGPARRAWLLAALHALDTDLQDAGWPRKGGRRRGRVGAALGGGGTGLRRTGSPYAVAPGTLTNGGSGPFQIFSPFYRAWLEHGVHGPAPEVAAGTVSWLKADERVPTEEPDPGLVQQAGEEPARRAWQAWLDKDPEGVSDYARLHNFPGPDATSHLSVALRWGHLHPRTVLADLAARPGKGSIALARQVAWRDFYADTLFHRPDAVTQPIKPEFGQMPTDEPDPGTLAAERLAAWQQGRTGYPLVDAGMRQLRAENWMHNRVRMVVASFLIKDLHLAWQHGAAYFMTYLYDGDIAQNQLNWQWVAGCGTDPAPYFRIFNPVKQSEKFDPDGTYIRRYLPELADVPDEHLHEPWGAPAGVPAGYPEPIVDHATERKRALERYAVVKG